MIEVLESIYLSVAWELTTRPSILIPCNFNIKAHAAPRVQPRNLIYAKQEQLFIRGDLNDVQNGVIPLQNPEWIDAIKVEYGAYRIAGFCSRAELSDARVHHHG